MAKNIMIQGTMSNAGKSLLCAGLCRILKQEGYRVAPFKSQNMALNSFITKDGGEMGRAQVVQAEAAGIEPDVRMNPILLKPTTDVGSQVIVAGQVQGNMRAMEYYRRKREYIPAILEAYNSLASEYDIIVIEGAGSPAEINLKQEDIVNMGLAKLVDAPVLLVGDIDRGGVFAQLYGTVALLEKDERARIKGTIVNKFRGDRAILEPGIRIQDLLYGGPVAGVCQGRHDDGNAAGAVAFVGDGFVALAAAGAGSLLQHALNVVVGHVGRLGLGDDGGQAGVVAGINGTAALFHGDDHFLCDFGKCSGALGVLCTLGFLDIMPFGMSGHKNIFPSGMDFKNVQSILAPQNKKINRKSEEFHAIPVLL